MISSGSRRTDTSCDTGRTGRANAFQTVYAGQDRLRGGGPRIPTLGPGSCQSRHTHPYHGAAFAFAEVWPELADIVVADNQGPYGLALKLGLSDRVAALVGRSFTLLLAGLAIVAAVRFRHASRWGRSLLWLSLLGLGSLASPGAWGDYVTTAAVWTLALLVILAFRDPRWIAPLLATVLFEGFLLGTIPIGDWGQGVMLSLSAIGSLLLLLLYVVILQTSPETFGQSAKAKSNAQQGPN